MRKHLLYCMALFLSFSTMGWAQRKGMDQGFGLHGSLDNTTGFRRVGNATTTLDINYRVRVKQFGIVYSIRKDLISWHGGSISIGSPMMLGMSFTNRYRSYDFDGLKTDTITGINGAHLAFEVPLVADLNFGLHSASEESRRRLGFYIGAGYQYSFTKIKTSTGKIPYEGFDPVFRAGIRMGAAWETRWSLGFNLRGINNKNRVYGLHLLKEL